MTNQSYTEDGGLAFPAYTYDTTLAGQVVRATDYGMTLRDYFAAKAMQGLAASNANIGIKDDPYSLMARAAYLTADAMLAERSKSK